MWPRRAFIVSIALTAFAAGVHAQPATTTKETAGAAQVTTSQIKGEVVLVDGNTLVAKMQPSGEFRTFNVVPGRDFLIDGQAKKIGDLKPGTVLTATMVTTTHPITVRTTTITNGTVVWVNGNYLVVTLDNGERRDYTVPEGFRFTVDGKQVSVNELKKGMKLSATKIVESPRNEIATETVVTGRAPK
jgi:hypothetical protein